MKAEFLRISKFLFKSNFHDSIFDVMHLDVSITYNAHYNIAPLINCNVASSWLATTTAFQYI